MKLHFIEVIGYKPVFFFTCFFKVNYNFSTLEINVLGNSL